ncbi:MAG: RdgB/HAM1 family non-canonical purine NTP pyrophosphatase [Oscillospiraceae bacterium]|nr:RdgB/HAM1 family non-canonical purine NTP pyrophosphatase [Oscillospiraceae bacterium]MBQ6849854.1 RdgB/HAM1 family non-canonical purine NTP pyrophosphatase [Oscillospiraceae bacterium]
MIFAAATNNAKKLKEIKRILNALGHDAKTLKELGIEIEIEENGTTFAENAVIKAKAIADICKMPTISDDSGLEVDFLNGAPGVYTARYAGENATDDENIDKLLTALSGVPQENRGAAFVSSVCLYVPVENGEDISVVCTGKCEGWIGYERIGDGGFGYDPIFMVGNASYSEMSADEKDAISHRGKALRLLGEEIAEMQF